MRITLVSPPLAIEQRYPEGHPLRRTIQVTEPLGLAYVAAMVEQNHDINVLDCIAEELTVSNAVSKIMDQVPDLLGISTVTPALQNALKLAREIKRVHPDMIVVLGGIHTTIFPQEVMRNREIDIVVIGEGERIMLDLAHTLENGAPLKAVQGIAYREDSSVVFNPPRPIERDIDTLPLPARHLLPMHRYKPFIAERYPARSLISSRGCPYQCVFCSRDVSGSRYRLRRVDKVVDEVKILVEKYGAREIDFMDPVFGLNRTWTREFCRELILEGLDVVWAALTRVDLIDESLLRIMRKSGCWQLYYGIEAGDQRLLDNIKKNIDLKHVRRSIELTTRVGIRAWGSFMFGLPGESPQLARKTLEFAKSLPLDFASFHLTTPFPGTELWNDHKRWGQITSVFDEFTQLNVVFVPFEWKGKETELQTLLREAFREFYFRPGYIVKQMMKVRSIDDLKLLCRGLRGFM